MKANIVFEFNGKRYRAVKPALCTRRECDLYDPSVCNEITSKAGYPCDVFIRELLDIGCCFPNCRWKEVSNA